MSSLEKLHKSMQMSGHDIQQFTIKMGVAEFDCLFSSRDAPMELTLTSKGAHPKFFLFRVSKTYYIKDYLDGATYTELLKVLSSHGISKNKLIPKDFLAELNSLIPNTSRTSSIPPATTIARLRKDLEESEKIYFDTWIYWKKVDSRKKPTDDNKKKTLAILGPEALRHSNKMNASSRWSSTPTGNDWKSGV